MSEEAQAFLSAKSLEFAQLFEQKRLPDPFSEEQLSLVKTGLPDAYRLFLSVGSLHPQDCRVPLEFALAVQTIAVARLRVEGDWATNGDAACAEIASERLGW